MQRVLANVKKFFILDYRSPRILESDAGIQPGGKINFDNQKIILIFVVES